MYLVIYTVFYMVIFWSVKYPKLVHLPQVQIIYEYFSGYRLDPWSEKGGTHPQFKNILC